MGAKQSLERTKRELADKLDVTFTANPFRSLDRRFMILFAARSGSHLLCEGLKEHGGVAGPFFHPQRIEKSRAPSLQAYLEAVLRKNAVAGTFGVKGGSYIFAHLSLAGEFPDFISEWGILYLTRRNIVRQAISRLVAKKTGAWASSIAPRRALSDDDFDAANIAGLINHCRAVNADCEAIFDAYGLTPWRIAYEDLASDPAGVTAGAAEYLGLLGQPITEERFIRPKVEVQSTDLNARWEARFREEEAWRVAGPLDEAG